MRRSYIFLGIVILILGVGVIYLTSAPQAMDFFKSKRTVTKPAEAGQLARGWVGSPYVDDYGMTRIPGYLDNISKNELANARIEIQLTDSSGNRKEIVKYTVESVPSGKRRTFDANAGALDGPRDATVILKSVEVVK